MSRASSRVVRAANRVPSATLANCISSTYNLQSLSCRIEAAHAADLNQSQKDSIWSTFEGNMYDFYMNSSFGWDPEAKVRELYNTLSRFILVYDLDSNEIIGFTMYRFEVEEDDDVIYCYDIQVRSSVQGIGLGRKLLDELDTLGHAFGMKKVMLTVFKANIRALGFYSSVGFKTDPSSPDYVESDDEYDPDSEEADYEILSKMILYDDEEEALNGTDS